MERGRKSYISPAGAFAHIDRITDRARIEALLLQLHFALLEGAGRGDLALKPQENGTRIRRQILFEIARQHLKIEISSRHQRRHAGLALAARHLDTVDVRLFHARKNRERFGDFRGGDVLSLPAEGVAGAVHEIEIAVLVAAHEIAGAEPRVALFERVPQDFFLGILALGVAVEAEARIVWIDLADRFADLSIGCFGTESVGSANRDAFVYVIADKPDLLDVAHVPRHAADRSDLSVVIDHADIAFGRAVELHDVRDRKARLEFRP